MGIVNSKDYINKRKIDEATSNSSLSNLRYVITEKPKWKVFKKKEIVPLPPNRGVNRCPCGSEAPCKQKVTPRGVTLHYPQPKKKRFGAFVHKRYTPPKTDKNYFNRFYQNLHVNFPYVSFKNIRIKSVYHKYLTPRVLRCKYFVKKEATKSLSRDFMFMPFLFENSVVLQFHNLKCSPEHALPKNLNLSGTGYWCPAEAVCPRTVQKVKLIRQKKFPTWRLDQISCKTPFASTAPPAVRGKTPPPTAEAAR